MKLFFTARRGATFQVGPTPLGRVWAALNRFVTAFALVTFAGAVVYLPDYLGRYRHEGAPDGFFLWLLLAVAGGVAAVLAVIRLLRREVWVIDLAEGVLVYESKRLLGRLDQVSVEIEEVERVDAHDAGFGGVSSVSIRLRESDRAEFLCRSRVSPGSIREVGDALGAFIEAQGWAVDTTLVERASAPLRK